MEVGQGALIAPLCLCWRELRRREEGARQFADCLVGKSAVLCEAWLWRAQRTSPGCLNLGS